MVSSINPNILTTYHAYVKAFNSRNFEEAADQFSFPLEWNDETHAREDQIAHMKRIIAGADIKSSVDVLLPNEDGPAGAPQLASRLIVSMRATEEAAAAYGLEMKGPVRTVSVGDHWFTWFTDDKDKPRIRKVIFVADFGALQQHLADPSHEAPDLSSSGVFGKTRDKGTAELEKLAPLWIQAICGKRMVEEAPNYLHEQVSFNGVSSSREDLANKLAWMMSHLGDAQVTIKTLVVNHEKQQVAARIEIEAPLAEAFGGFQPTPKPIILPEHLIYQFDGNKICGALTVLDLQSIGKQVAEM